MTTPSRSHSPTPATRPLRDLAGTLSDGGVTPESLHQVMASYRRAYSNACAVARGFSREVASSWQFDGEGASYREILERLVDLGDARSFSVEEPVLGSRCGVVYLSAPDAEISIEIMEPRYSGDFVEVHVRVYGAEIDTCEHHIQCVRALYPEWVMPEQEEDRSVIPMTFWHMEGGKAVHRHEMLPAISWDSVCDNYTAPVAQAIGRLVGSGEGAVPARLHLWSGPPGTGKTHAIQAVAEAWRDWVHPHYISDPEQFFGSAQYMMQMLAGLSGSKSSLLILEDAGEYLRPDAPALVGQGFSRLLNLTDGILGIGRRLMLLVTTNVEIKDLHPAASRPGRAASNLSFEPLDAHEATMWLTTMGMQDPSVTGSMTLAELYAQLDAARAPVEARAARQAVGFSA